jgi:hypothetical protein
LRNPEDKLESILRDSTRNLIQHLTAIHGYLQLLQGEEISAVAREIVRKLIDHDQRACSMLETLIALEHSQRNIGNHASVIPVQQTAIEQPRSSQNPEPVQHGSRVLLIGADSAMLEFERQVLFHMGADILEETNIENARSLLISQEFGLVLIDENCLRPGQVEEFCSWMQASRPQARERTVFLVAAASQADLEKLAVRSLRKPLQIMELIQCSREFLPFAATAQSSPGTVH